MRAPPRGPAPSSHRTLTLSASHCPAQSCRAGTLGGKTPPPRPACPEAPSQPGQALGGAQGLLQEGGVSPWRESPVGPIPTDPLFLPDAALPGGSVAQERRSETPDHSAIPGTSFDLLGPQFFIFKKRIIIYSV